MISARGVRQRLASYGPSAVRGRAHVGWCPICEARTVFVNTGGHPRNHLFCIRCNSLPRWRALIDVLTATYPNWRDLVIHESSPGGPSAQKLRREAPRYSASFFLPTMRRGTTRDGMRNEDLERLTFPDRSFDLFVTQDVFEHLFDAAAALREIARVLRPNGAHVFTVPYWPDRGTRVRAVRTAAGVEHVRKPIYHDDPVDPLGALVVRDWGSDFTRFIEDASGLETEIVEPHDRRKGLLGDFAQVFVTRKPAEQRPDSGMVSHEPSSAFD